MRFERSGWILVAALTLVFLTLYSAHAAETTEADGKAAVVNGKIIPMSELDRAVDQMKMRMSMMGQSLSAEQIDKMKQDILGRLIDQALLYQESQKQGIEVAPEEVTESLKSLRDRFPDEEAFKKALEKAGVDEALLKSQKQEELAVRKLIDREVVGKVTVSEEESKSYYKENGASFKEPEQVQASHILVKVDSKADDTQKAEARKKIEEVQGRLEKGDDFAALAKEYSDCPSKESGGDLGMFPRGKMVKPFEEKAFGMKPGEVSDLVETRFGYHIIKVTDKKPARDIPYEEVKDRIDQHLKNQKVEAKLDEYLADLKKKAEIEVLVQASASSEEAAKPEKSESPEEPEKKE